MTYARLLMLISPIGILVISCGLIPGTTSPNEPPTVSVDDPRSSEQTILEATPTKSVVEITPTIEFPIETTENLPEIPDKPFSDYGPWWIFSTPKGMFAINPDGSGLTQFYFEPINSPYVRQILTAPRGGHLAYLEGESFDVTLRINYFPWRDLLTNKPLLSFNSDLDTEAIRAIVEYQSMAFSPDGQFLAFMGAIDGPTSDLYLYSLDSYKITQLTDGPSQSFQPVWSPDGKYIVHMGVSSFGSGAGSQMTGVWAAQADNTNVKKLYDTSGSGFEKIIGWVDNQSFVVYSWDMSCGNYNLRIFNIETKESSILWGESFRTIAFDQSNAVAVLSSNDGECSPDDGAGIYIVPTDGNAHQRIVENTGPKVIWSQDANLFLVSGDFGSWMLAVDSNGQFIDLDMPLGGQVFPSVAPGSKEIAWPGESLWIGPLLGSIENPPKEIFNEPVYNVTWTPDGQSVIFFADSGLYIAHQPEYTPILIDSSLDNRNGYSSWLFP